MTSLDNQEPRSKTYMITLGLLVLGGLGGVWSLSQVWVTATLFQPGLPTEFLADTGATLYPVALVGSWLAVASAIAIIALGAKARKVIGVLAVLCAVAVLVSPVAFFVTDSAVRVTDQNNQFESIAVATTHWYILLLPCSIAIAIAGVLAIVASSQWRSLSNAQTGSQKTTKASDWEVFDRGDDPTN